MVAQGERQPKHLLICCEGKETEPQYFNAVIKKRRVRQGRVKVKVVRGQGQHKILIDNAVKMRTEVVRTKKVKASDVEVWAVCDKDLMHFTLEELLAYAKKRNVRLAFSDPSFEIFLLQHFCRSSAGLSGRALEARISKEMTKLGISTNYTKEDISFILDMLHNDPLIVEQAIKNCSMISDPQNAPYTTVHTLVERMLLFAV